MSDEFETTQPEYPQEVPVEPELEEKGWKKKSKPPVSFAGNDPDNSMWAGKTQNQATVRILNSDQFDGRYVTMNVETGEVYLVSNDLLTYSVKDQSIALRDLEASDRPYTFDKEIDSLVITPDEIRKALWTEGLISPASLENLSVRSLILQLVRRGVLPVTKEQGNG